MTMIRGEHLYKVFGPQARKAVDLFEQGWTRDEVKEQTGALGAVIDADIDVAEGELFVVMGLSGSGKSTLVRMINRLHDPTSGTVEIDGVNVTELDGKELRDLRAGKVSMVFQRFALFPHMTILDNAAWGLETQQVDKDERYEKARKALSTVGLDGWEANYASELSGGMQQRVGLARALATEADILLMDEPFSALDPLIKRDMQSLLIELQSELRKSIIFITHDLNEAMRLGDRIAVMKDGRIEQTGEPDEILSNPATEYVAEFVRDVDRSRVLTAANAVQDPLVTLSPDTQPRAAMVQMRDHEAAELFVTESNRTLVGAVRDSDVSEAAKRGDRTIRDVLHHDYGQTGEDTPLGHTLLDAARYTLPLAVVDEQGRLVGVIPRVTLLSALANRDVLAEDGDPDANGSGPPDAAELAAQAANDGQPVASDGQAHSRGETTTGETPAEEGAHHG